MCKEVSETRILRELEYYLRVESNTKYIHDLKLVEVHILEVEDVLFHLNSAVMMPARPSGTATSTDGTEDDATDPEDAEIQEKQDQVTGLDVIAIALKQFDLDPDKRMLIVGHTDTSGGYKMNFELSDQRAMGVLYLIEGERTKWAKISANRHRTEDYQQIMTWICENPRFKWPCDPKGIDDKWGGDSKEATRQFQIHYNQWIAGGNADSTDDSDEQTGDAQAPLSPTLHEDVNRDPKHKWPEEAWAAVYDLYQDELKHKLGEGKPEDPPESPCSPTHRRLRRKVRFVSETKKFVGCGESFPIDDEHKNEYRSQLNRRVEILFFDDGEAPDLESEDRGCPTDLNRAHTKDECPLYNGWLYIPNYISPGDLNAVGYHVKFAYYNRVLGRRAYVPDGLEFKAYEDEDKEVPTAHQHKKDTYLIKVKDNPDRTKLFFEFNTENRWIYTADADTPPEIKTYTPDEISNISPEDRHKYYDLPAKWHSRNYWTRGEDTAFVAGDRYEKVMKDERGIKPYGSNLTSPEEPLVFSLDDIVLLDSVDGTQDIKDKNHRGADKDLSNRSRLKLFVVDATTKQLKLHQPESDFKSARIAFAENYVPKPPEDVKIVFFRDGFYTVADKRTRELDQWGDKGFVVGARAALREDADRHVKWVMKSTADEFGRTGDYELHYFHNLHHEDGHPVSFALPYLGINFMADPRNEPSTADASVNKFAPIPSDSDVQKFVDEGVYRAMDTYNRKRYFLEEHPAGDHAFLIRPLYFFDEREHFKAIEPAGGWQNCNFDNHPDDNAASNFERLYAHQAIKNAEAAALGGRPKLLSPIINDDGGSYFWAVRRETEARRYSILKLRQSVYQPMTDPLGKSVAEHGETWRIHVMAHELGHGTGHKDEYQNKKYKPYATCSRKYLGFTQHYVPYSMEPNSGSMMNHNCAPRARYLWYVLHRFNTDAADDTKDLHNFLEDKTFAIRLRRGTFDVTHRRILTGGNPSVPNDRQVAMETEAQHQITADPLRRCRLELYDTNQDESSVGTFHAAQGAMQYQAVLMVRVYMRPYFEGTWTNPERRARINAVQQAFLDWGGHYRLIGGTGDIENVYVHFLPGFCKPGDSDQDRKHYDTRFTDDTDDTTVQAHPTHNERLFIDETVTAATVVNYFFNRGTTDSGEDALQFLKTWIDTKLPGTFTLQSFGGPP